jgi:hypothetical protein
VNRSAWLVRRAAHDHICSGVVGRSGWPVCRRNATGGVIARGEEYLACILSHNAGGIRYARYYSKLCPECAWGAFGKGWLTE